MSLCPAPVEPRPDPSSTLWFRSAGLNSSTMSRFELKPPVATTTALLLTATGSPVLALRPSRPVTRPSSTAEPGDLGLGNDLAALLAEAVDQVGHQAEPVALGPGPAQHGVALLDFHVDPLHAEAFGPVIEIVQGVLDVVAGPDHVGRRTAPRDPVLEGQVGRVVDAVLLLQRRADDQAAAAGDDGRTAGLGALLEGDGARSCIAGLDAGRHTGAARADDGDVGFVLLDTCHRRKLPVCQVR